MYHFISLKCKKKTCIDSWTDISHICCMCIQNKRNHCNHSLMNTDENTYRHGEHTHTRTHVPAIVYGCVYVFSSLIGNIWETGVFCSFWAWDSWRPLTETQSADSTACTSMMFILLIRNQSRLCARRGLDSQASERTLWAQLRVCKLWLKHRHRDYKTAGKLHPKPLHCCSETAWQSPGRAVYCEGCWSSGCRLFHPAMLQSVTAWFVGSSSCRCSFPPLMK